MAISLSPEYSVSFSYRCRKESCYHTLVSRNSMRISNCCSPLCVAHCTVKIVQDSCRAIVQNLMEAYIKFPTGEELKRAVARFEEEWGFPQCVFAIDC